MKGIIIFTIVLLAIVLGHDAWISYDKDLPFALSDFGWIVNTYIPDAEPYIMDNTSEYVQEEFIGTLFKVDTVWVVLSLMGVLIVLAGFAKLSEGMGDINLSFNMSKSKDKSKNKGSDALLKRNRSKKMEYKRK